MTRCLAMSYGNAHCGVLQWGYPGTAACPRIFTKAELARRIRGHVGIELYDNSGMAPKNGCDLHAMTDFPRHSYRSFGEFYPFYLAEHANRTCRRLHFISSCLVAAVLVAAAATANFWLLWFIPVLGYGLAWVGQFAYEKSQPATFQYPLYSLMGDWVMFKDTLIGRIRF